MEERKPELTETQLKALRIGVARNIEGVGGGSSVPVSYWQEVDDARLRLAASGKRPQSPYESPLNRLVEEVLDNLRLPSKQRWEGFRDL